MEGVGHWPFVLTSGGDTPDMRQSLGLPQQGPFEMLVVWADFVRRSERVADSKRETPTSDYDQPMPGLIYFRPTEFIFQALFCLWLLLSLMCSSRLSDTQIVPNPHTHFVQLLFHGFCQLPPNLGANCFIRSVDVSHKYSNKYVCQQILCSE